MAVLKTTSPEARPVAPAEVPRNTVPSANARRAGGAAGTAAGSLGCHMCRAGPARTGPALQRAKKYTVIPPAHQTFVFRIRSLLTQKAPLAKPCQNGRLATHHNSQEQNSDFAACLHQFIVLGRVSTAASLAPLPILRKRRPRHSP